MPDKDANAGLGASIQRGVAWKLGGQAFTQVARVLFALVLARLLTPVEYGLAGMALVFSGLILAFADLGLGAALIQRRVLSEKDKSTVFWTSVASGLVFTGIGIALAGPIARLFGQPEVKNLAIATSFGFLLTSVATTQRSLLTRELEFGKLELRVVASTVAGGVVGIGLALAGLGAWAIVGQVLTLAFVSSATLWFVSTWRPRFLFSVASLRSMGTFSGQVFGERFLYYSTESVTNAMIGHRLGAASLGTFTVANNVVLLPFSRIAIPVGEVLFPAFSRIQDEPRRVAAMWLRAIPLLAAVCLPALVGLAILAPEFVRVVLGDQWIDAVPVVQILCLVGIANTLRAWNVGILMSFGRGDLIFRFAIGFSAAYVAATLIGMHWGVVGVAAGFAVAAAVVEVPYLVVTARELGVSVRAVFAALSGVGQATALMALGLVTGRAVLVQASMGPALRLVILVGLGTVLFGLACAWRAPAIVAELREQLSRRGRLAFTCAAARPTEQ